MTASPSLLLKVRGMDCADCARTVENGVGQLAGVQSCQVSFATEKLQVAGTVGRADVVRRVRELGYDVEDEPTAATPALPAQGGFLHYLLRRRDTRLALLGAVLILPGVLLGELGGIHHWVIDLCSLAALATAGYPIARSAWAALRLSHTVNINVLMTIAAAGAVLIGAYTEAGMVMVLFAIGEALEGYTVGKARQAIHSLVDLLPTTAARLHTVDSRATAEVVPVADLRIGNVILVKPGERIPMDGRVLAGVSAVNQAPITGESRLVEKSAEPAGDNQVYASSVNGAGALEIEVTHLVQDNTISRMIALVEEAQEKRAPAQRFVDRFAAVYTPAVVIIAILVAVVPPLLFGQPFLNPAAGGYGWLYRGLALLVVACPCALVISTPVSIISAIGNAAHNGILVKGGAALETLARVRAIAFDKTGTLTEGRPSVVAVRTLKCGAKGHKLAGALTQGPLPWSPTEEPCAACDDLLALAGAVEERSEHPVAFAIVQEAARRGVLGRYPAAEQVQSLAGRGVTGRVDGMNVLAGSHSLFDGEIPHPAEDCQAAAHDMERGHTPLLISVDGAYVGTITVADTVRTTSRAAVHALQAQGFAAIVMLTGDHPVAAGPVAAAVGIDAVHAELLPAHKVDIIARLRHQYGTVAMIGDGVNDAPALASADVGVAIGAAGGRTQAMETADVTVMSGDLRRLPFLFQLGRSTLRTIHVNVALSIGIKLVFVVLVLAGLGTMWMAVLADMGTSLLVTLYGMRLRRRPRLQV